MPTQRRKDAEFRPLAARRVLFPAMCVASLAALILIVFANTSAYPQPKRPQPSSMNIWAGKYPDAKFFNQPLIKNSLRRILSKDDYDSIANYNLMTPIVRIGEHLVAHREVKYAEPRESLWLALSLKDGAVYIVFWTGEEHRKFSTNNNQFNLPEEVLTELGLSEASATPANQAEFSSVADFLGATLHGESQLTDEAKGDLNGDGLDDWAGVIRREKGEFQQTSQLYVLLQQQGGYRVAEKSREEQIAGMGCCWVEDLQINRSSVYIQNNAKTAVTMEAATHQFKLYNNEWRLIGVKIYHIDHSTDVATETDMNLLSGAVIEKRSKGENKPTVKRRKKAFAKSLLKDFDFFNGFGIQ